MLRKIFARTSNGQVVDHGRSAVQWIRTRRVAAMAMVLGLAIALALALGMCCSGRRRSLGGRETGLVPPHLVVVVI